MKSNSRYAIRVDATDEMGTGHFMRCLALANALGRRGGRVQFFGRRIPEALRDMAVLNGHSVSLLESRDRAPEADGPVHAHWLGTTQRADAERMTDALQEDPADAVIVDHYALDARWESTLRKHAGLVMVIDDLADRRHDCDLLVDQNLFKDMSSRYASTASRECRLLLGPDYALLREEFREARSRSPVREGAVRRILILMGGVDLHNLTGRAIDAVASLGLRVGVDVVVTRLHSQREFIAARCHELGFACHVQPRDIASLMVAADLAVGACGSTAWERCCLRLPTICVAEAANQIPIAEGLAARGAVVNLGGAESAGVHYLARAITALVTQPSRVYSLSSAAGRLVDGLGTERVCRELEQAA